ncbi:MAG: glycoside hydrolase family 3 N-terminal domain-containing protein [Pseudomonadota bacterium]
MAAGAYILGCAGPTLSGPEAAFFREADPWGFILFQRNIETPEQTRALTSALRETVGREAPILIDQEGGRVQRMWGPTWRVWHPALDQIGDMPVELAAEGMALRTRLISHELLALGIDVNCTPLGDVASDETHPVLLNRCYGREPDRVIAIARAVAEAQEECGVLPILKHIPGHGSTGADSHVALPRVDKPRAALEAWDFTPFRALSDLPMGMTAHVVYSDIDPVAATISPKMIALIREDIGFDGLLMTDDLSMEALGGTPAERTGAALAAGCDLILHCNGEMAEMEAVAGAAGRLTAQALPRAEAALARRRTPTEIDIAATEAKLKALLQGEVYA